MTSRMMRLLAAILVGILAISGCNKTTGPQETDDTITILSVTPNAGLIPDTETDFTVVIEYELVSTDSGEVNIGFNSVEVGRYQMIEEASALVTSGTGEHQFNISVLVKDWGNEGDFEVFVNLSEHPHGFTWTPLAWDTWTLTF